jgi:hypothetical protein
MIEITVDADLLFYAVGDSTKKRGPSPGDIKNCYQASAPARE